MNGQTVTGKPIGTSKRRTGIVLEVRDGLLLVETLPDRNGNVRRVFMYRDGAVAVPNVLPSRR